MVLEKTDDLHKITAAIMQCKAIEFRYLEMTTYQVHPNICNPRQYLSRPEPTGRHWRAGIHHSIMWRTQSAHASAILWVDQWLDLNSDVVLELGKLLHAKPLHTYFA